MFIIHVESVHGRWIGAVCSRQDALEKYLASIDGEYWKQYLIEVDIPSYPLYICEEHQGFRFLSEQAIIEELSMYAHELRRKNEEWYCYTNLYRITRDWMPKHPGDDRMGSLPHHHIRNSLLDLVEREGFQALWH
jgi:hypothetical protein